ncbi:unnamed protein product, partial [Cunninghamella blakesleeana]
MNEMDNITLEDIINNETFIKNIKRMFIIKQIETYSIEKITIEFDKNIKSFKINLEKNKEKYYLDYKIKRRRKKQKGNTSIKKRKILEISDAENKNNKYINTSKCNFVNKIIFSDCYISPQVDLVNEIKDNNIDSVNINNNKFKENVEGLDENKLNEKKIIHNSINEENINIYKEDELCK